MNYKIQIDGLRFFAIISVLIGHWISYDTRFLLIKHIPWAHGVILFFVISGFLITDILLNQKQKIDERKSTIAKSLKTFYIRRFFRIFPIYYLLIFFLFFINYPKARELFIWLVTYTSNIYEGLSGNYAGDFNHFWSLAVEEQFYIFWPLLIFIIPKKHLLKFFIVTLILSFCARLGYYHLYPDNWMMAAYMTPGLLLPLVLGALVAYFKREKPVWFYNFFKPIMAHVLLLLYIVTYYYFQHLTNNYFYKAVCDQYVFAVVCVFYVANASVGSFWGISGLLLENRLSNYIGRISYGIYLYHLFIPTFFLNVFVPITGINTDSRKTAAFFYLLITVCLAHFSYRLIEKPINRLKDKFSY